MTDTLVLNAKTRSDIGKGASRRLRREQNLIPAVVYGTDKPATSLTFDHNKVIKFLESEAVYSSILTINIDGTPEQVVLKDLQRHPFKPKVLHMDFMRIDANAKIHMNVPLHFTNQDKAPGVIEGGVASHLMTEVEVICLPKDLAEFIEINIEALGMDASIHLSEVALPSGIELAIFSHGEDSQDPAVVSIHKPRAVVEETDETAAEGEEATADEEGDAKAEGEEKGESGDKSA